MLITDCAISPKGELVICCHSGPPDWGSGPAKDGRLFRIRYSDPVAPQPVLAWSSDPTTSVIAFDRTLTASDWQNLTQRIHVEGGRFTEAGDRFEAIRPGYAVVRAQQTEPAVQLAVTSATLGSDGRSIVIKTEPRTKAVSYAIAIDVPRKDEGIKQADAIDLAHTLGGLQATWKGKDGSDWSGWLPHPNFAVAKTLTRGSAIHDAAWDRLSQPGKLVLQTQLNLSHLLQPAVQPGSKLDYTPEPETVTITLKSDSAISVNAPGSIVKSGGREVTFTKKVTGDDWQPLTIELATPATTLEATFTTAIDARPRPLGVRRFLMPFATKPAPAATSKVTIPQTAGGNYANGHRLFMGKATCFTCHQIRGEGHAVGPDLSNTAHRDYASVLRDLEDPNATINPDAVAYQVTLKNGGSAVGTRIGETATELKLAAPGGQVTTVKKSEIAKTTALPVSLMPPGLLSVLSEQERKDLMTFLLSEPQRDE